MQDTKVLHLGRVQIVPPSFFTPDFASVVQLQFFKLRHVLFLKKIKTCIFMSKRSRQIIMMFLFTYAHAEPSQLFFYVNRFTHVTNK
jgi:hypothetical protein